MRSSSSSCVSRQPPSTPPILWGKWGNLKRYLHVKGVSFGYVLPLCEVKPNFVFPFRFLLFICFELTRSSSDYFEIKGNIILL